MRDIVYIKKRRRVKYNSVKNSHEQKNEKGQGQKRTKGDGFIFITENKSAPFC